MVEFLAQDPDREPLAGDQLYLDLDLSHANLPAGSTLIFGASDGVGVVSTGLDREVIARVRSQIPMRAHRRLGLAPSLTPSR
jgi:hypothetical protein